MTASKTKKNHLQVGAQAPPPFPQPQPAPASLPPPPPAQARTLPRHDKPAQHHRHYKRSVVYDAYDITHPPQHPGHGWTRFVCVSDTHCIRFPVPAGDVLLHSGDLTEHGTLKDLESSLDWLKSLSHPVKFFIAGNHDICLDPRFLEGGSHRKYRPRRVHDKDISDACRLVRSESLRRAGLYYVEHETVLYTTKGGKVYSIYGSPSSVIYHYNGAFQYPAGHGRALYDAVPPTTDILMTHSPAHGICDLTKHGAHGGCRDLARRLEHSDLRHCRLHAFGHIHEGHRVETVGKSERNPSGRVCANAALPNVPLPVIVDLQD
ncbi:Metallo-dependent phosphatase [Epithele typhae]|uniref:Metallo-dependent phosphatase n=1 Tax=Epithele typhae TaxID=378194 RepID=UPI0020089D55|nr:Metallo-dependent phosphatase [Epithele typhae]KAH9931730.1 Metallo-dependent phosphatase [Epithele typhae]